MDRLIGRNEKDTPKVDASRILVEIIHWNTFIKIIHEYLIHDEHNYVIFFESTYKRLNLVIYENLLEYPEIFPKTAFKKVINKLEVSKTRTHDSTSILLKKSP